MIYNEMSNAENKINEARLYFYSETKKLKESSIWSRKAAKFEAELIKNNDRSYMARR
jgi:hypothetical protein